MLIVFALFAAGFAAGYGVREIVSRGRTPVLKIIRIARQAVSRAFGIEFWGN
jgi:hypothetical protein